METKQIYYALFIAHPSTEPPFGVEIGLNNHEKLLLDNCKHIPDAIERIELFCKENNISFAPQFTLLYPIFMEAMDTEFEQTMHSIAWMIKEQADKKNWKFDRVGGYTGNMPNNFMPK